MMTGLAVSKVAIKTATYGWAGKWDGRYHGYSRLGMQELGYDFLMQYFWHKDAATISQLLTTGL